jgi:hypothetical protein
VEAKHLDYPIVFTNGGIQMGCGLSCGETRQTGENADAYARVRLRRKRPLGGHHETSPPQTIFLRLAAGVAGDNLN